MWEKVLSLVSLGYSKAASSGAFSPPPQQLVWGNLSELVTNRIPRTEWGRKHFQASWKRKLLFLANRSTFTNRPFQLKVEKWWTRTRTPRWLCWLTSEPNWDFAERSSAAARAAAGLAPSWSPGETNPSTQCSVWSKSCRKVKRGSCVIMKNNSACQTFLCESYSASVCKGHTNNKSCNAFSISIFLKLL